MDRWIETRAVHDEQENKGPRYPADPPTVEEIILVMRQAGPGRYATGRAR
jgi:hypothetical protein